MGWATNHIQKLQNGETVKFRPHGNSMAGKIDSGQLCTVEPVNENTTFVVGNIVLCKVYGTHYLHLITATRMGDRYQISNNKGHINGWINRKQIYGKLVDVTD